MTGFMVASEMLFDRKLKQVCVNWASFILRASNSISQQ